MKLKNFIKEELNEFKNYHKNQMNVIIHILTGVVYMSCLNVLLFNGRLLVGYFLLIAFSHNMFDAALSILFIYIGTCFILKYKVKSIKLIFIFLFTCFVLPEISHLLTNEKIQLQFENLTVYKFLTNIFYFLPFSINTFNNL